jgi:hypothetical protein
MEGNNVLNNSYPSQTSWPADVIKSRTMKWEGKVAGVWDIKNSIYIQNVGRRPFRRPSCRREDNIKMVRKKQALNGELDSSGTEQEPVAGSYETSAFAWRD